MGNTLGDVVASVQATETSPSTEVVSLPSGTYGADVAPGYGCSYAGELEGQPLRGCRSDDLVRESQQNALHLLRRGTTMHDAYFLRRRRSTREATTLRPTRLLLRWERVTVALADGHPQPNDEAPHDAMQLRQIGVIFRARDGRFVEVWHAEDVGALQRALGMPPPPRPLMALAAWSSARRYKKSQRRS